MLEKEREKGIMSASDTSIFAADAFPPSKPQRAGYEHTHDGKAGAERVRAWLLALGAALGAPEPIPFNAANARAIINAVANMRQGHEGADDAEVGMLVAEVSPELHAGILGHANAERRQEVVRALQEAHDEAFADFVQEQDVERQLKYEHIGRACGFSPSPPLPPEVIDLSQ